MVGEKREKFFANYPDGESGEIGWNGRRTWIKNMQPLRETNAITT